MIGTSLSYRNLLNTEDPLLSADVILPKLWERGVRSIELRAVPIGGAPEDALRVANILWDYGFHITVHSNCKTAENAVSEVFDPLRALLGQMRQRELIITIHPIAGDNVGMLTSLSDHIIEKGYPVRIALENNRKMPDKIEGDSAALVLDAVKRTNRENVGICFDMGHYAWYAAKFTDSPNTLPPKEFLSRVIHTHMHAYAEGNTHFHIGEWCEPISLYVEALGYKYLGVYNAELEPARFPHIITPTEAYLTTADTMRENYPPYAAFYDEMRESYDEYFRRALDVFNHENGTYGTLIGPSSYLFSTNGYKWGMDPSFLNLYRLAESPSRVREYLGGLDCILLTHAHSDHMEARTVRALADTDIIWVAPEFLLKDLLNFGVRREYIRSVMPGDSITVGPLSIRVLEGRHFRPDTGAGLAAVGYLVSADNAPSIAFPSDVRDYRFEGSDSLDADHCFAHVWLTDAALIPEMYLPKCREFAEFMLSRSRKSIFLTHLYSYRSEDAKWTLTHARAASEAIRRLSPETVVRTPRYGEVFELL